MTFTVDQLNRILGFSMSDEQLAAVTADLDIPLLVVAGAGSGKTTVMAARVLWAVGTQQCAPDEIVGLTFTKKAAGELGSRIRQLLEKLFDDYPPVGFDGEPGSPLVSTYHAFAHQFVAEHGLRIGVEPGARLLSETESLQEAYRVVVNTEYPLTGVGLAPVKLAEVVVKLDQQLSEHLATP
ncbi:MAG TPA: ATP-dependent DNA helicase, partial [Actinobacteria bacterium]|nr:ATP-dependent DNA helicase [Actinomycetota bacterium]